MKKKRTDEEIFGRKEKSTTQKGGKLTVKKRLKKGKTYTVKVKVTAAGSTNYKSKSKTVKLKIKVQ